MNMFPNGFTSWHETHYQMVEFIVLQITNEPTGVVKSVHEDAGTGGLFELAKEWTNEFEIKFKGVEWGVDINYPEWFDATDQFCHEKNKV